jgi:chemotaxis response regulator CheB
MTTIADQPDIELVGKVSEKEDLTDAAAQFQPDALTLATDEPDRYRVQCGFLLGRNPEMKILALAPHQNRARFYLAILDIRSKPLESPEAGILDAMRKKAQILGAQEFKCVGPLCVGGVALTSS